MLSALFLAEGSSDHGITLHIERIAFECDVEIRLTVPPTELLRTRDKSVAGKLSALSMLGGDYDLVFVHRDADGAGRDLRVAEIGAAMSEVMPGTPFVPIVPVRMTEAWLVLDEKIIRQVSGNPNGRVHLDMPSAREAERIADPKSLLKELLATASETTGRRRQAMNSAFFHNRRRLLEELDPSGAVCQMESWRLFVDDTTEAIRNFG